MRALVTGASGFIGGFLVQELVRRGHEVVCLLRPTSAREHLPKNRVEIRIGSLGDPASLSPAVEGVDWVFHLAGATKALQPQDFFRVNAQGTENLLRACLTHNARLRRFLLVSSLAAAGPAPDPSGINESDPPRPVSHYGRSKLAAEEAVLQHAAEVPVTIVRPPVVYGPRDRDVYEYFKQVKAGVALHLGRAERYFSIIHVADLVAGILRAAQVEAAAGRVYFLANPKAVTWRELGEEIARALDKRPLKIVVPEASATVVAALSELTAKLTRRPALLGFDKVREMKERYWVCRADRAAQELGFRPRFSMQEGVRDTVQWYRQAGWL